MKIYDLNWHRVNDISGIRYICGYCGTDTSPNNGWAATARGSHRGFVLICTGCNRPSFIDIDGDIQTSTPAAKMGTEVRGLPEDVAHLYDEARKCTATGAFTSAVLTCRKILMHIAVEKGAPVGLNFADYVDYLAKKGYIPPNGRDWVDHIRTKSNEANHEINIMNNGDAEDLITFTEMLLRLVYEFKNRLPKPEVNTSS
jgi:hypothetical protein